MSKLVCIDPGHSGPVEPGAVFGEVTEAALVLAIAGYVAAALRKAGHEVVLTRCGDIDSDDLAFRAEMANEAAADSFVSIHCNSFGKETAQGVEVFCYPDSVAGSELADLVYAQLVDKGYTRGRGVKAANFAVLRLTDMPAVLVECAFLSNAADRAVLTSAAGQQMIASAMAKGIDLYLARL